MTRPVLAPGGTRGFPGPQGRGVLGIMLVISRSGWLSLFMAVTVVGQIDVLPVLCIALLPVSLLVTDRPRCSSSP